MYGLFSMLICWLDGFLGVLPVGVLHCIAWVFLGLHDFVRGVCGFVRCAGILINLLSSF